MVFDGGSSLKIGSILSPKALELAKRDTVQLMLTLRWGSIGVAVGSVLVFGSEASAVDLAMITTPWVLATQRSRS